MERLSISLVSTPSHGLVLLELSLEASVRLGHKTLRTETRQEKLMNLLFFITIQQPQEGEDNKDKAAVILSFGRLVNEEPLATLGPLT